MRWPALDGDGWVTKQSLAYLGPVGWVLHGLVAEKSASGRGVYLWVLQMPLYVPSEVVDLSWSERWSSGTATFELADHATATHVLDASRQAKEHHDESQIVVPPPGGVDSVRMQEAHGYGLLLTGAPGGALEVLERVSRYSARFDWEEDLLARAGSMRALIERDAMGEARAQLAHWRDETLSALDIRLSA